MANPAHLEKLCEGPKAWNAWREANPNIVPDLSEIQLTLHQRQLGPSNGGPIDLHAADLERAILRYATLSGADLEGCRLVGADLTHARLDKAKLSGADLTEAVLDQADLTGAVLEQAVLFGTDLSDTRNLTRAQIEQALGDASTKLPSSLLPPESWFPPEHDVNEDDYAGWGMASYEEPVEQSLYEILGLTRKAGSDEIRSAYRILVKKLHPDLNPNDEEAQERFRQVTTAYRILNDAEKRASYDRNEIDNEGRVNPEFEARRNWRRAAYRYYGAALASLMLAAGVLVGVWYTVLSLQPEDVRTPQVAVVTPKSSERLTRAPARTVRPEKDIARDEERALSSETPSQNATSGQAQQDAPKMDDDEALARNPASDAQRDKDNAISASDQAIETAARIEALQPMLGDADARGEENASQTPAANPSDPQSGQAARVLQSMAEVRRLTAPTQPALQKETTQRPLREGHNSAAGQNKPSAPEGWSVASLPSPAQQIWATNANPRQAGSNASTPRFEAIALSRWAQHPTGRDMVSQVLRARAFRQAIGEGKRPLASVEGVWFPARRAGNGPDLPTNALPGKAGSTFVKPMATSLQRKRQESPTPETRAPANSVAASKALVSPRGPKRELRQQQAVTDIFSGGL